MASKDELQNLLKNRYGINKNISQALTLVECQRLLTLLDAEPSAIKLVESFIGKNAWLGNNNRQLGHKRGRAEDRLEKVQAEYTTLKASIQEIETSNQGLIARKQQLEQEAAQRMQQLEQSKARLAQQQRQLEQEARSLAQSKTQLEQQKLRLEKESQVLEAEVKALTDRSSRLEGQVTALSSANQELKEVNHELKKDNKRLKNIVDAIRLKFSQEAQQMLKTEDSEIRKAIVRLYKSMLG
jgi:chromosome segregation ATPase